METLDEEGQSTTEEVSFPGEIIEDILTRLPVKSILRCRTLSKQLNCFISNPSFTKLHFSRPHRTALFISAINYSDEKRYFLSAPLDGGPVTLLTTLENAFDRYIREAQHLNGLVFVNCMDCVQNCRSNFVFNPSTHKIFKVPYPYPNEGLRGASIEQVNIHHLLGFDESTNEHKILCFGIRNNPYRVEVMIFSMSSYSWRKIAVPPVGFSTDYKPSVCVNSVVHLTLANSFDILAFDLRTEKFSMINTLQALWPHDDMANYPSLIKINGCIGAVYDRAMKHNEMHIFILQDYENQVWVKETITFPKPWLEFGCPFPLDSINMDEIIFSSSNISKNVMNVPIYNMKSGCFKSLKFTLGHQFKLSTIFESVEFDQIKCYVESMVPLQRNKTRLNE